MFVGDLGRSRTEHARRAAHRHEHDGGGSALCGPGQPRAQAGALARWAQGDDRPWPAADRSINSADGAAAFARRAADISRRAAQPSVARRRTLGCRPCRTEGGDDRARLGRRARVRALRRDDRRDRRIRPAGAAPTGPRTIAATTTVVYGHTPVPRAEWVNNTLCIDTGCVFGGKLTALRWPEKRARRRAGGREFIASRCVRSQPRRTCARGPGGSRRYSRYARRERPALDRHRTARPHRGGGGKCGRRTGGHEPFRDRAAMARLSAADHVARAKPARARAGWSGPEEAFAHFRQRGVARGRVRGKAHGFARGRRAVPRRPTPPGRGSASRAAKPARSGPEPAARSSRDADDDRGAVRAVARGAGCVRSFGRDSRTDWLLLDAEIMPWSAKAGALIDSQYAPVATRRGPALALPPTPSRAPARAACRSRPFATRFADRAERAEAYAHAWSPYVWPVSGVGDLQVAPFHLLASEGRVWFDQRSRLAHGDSPTDWRPLATTSSCRRHWRMVDLGDEAACADAVGWWEELTGDGRRRHGGQAARLHCAAAPRD